MRATPGITFITSILILGEALTLTKTTGVILILAAGFVLSYHQIKRLRLKPLILTSFCALCLGIAWTNDKVAVAHFPISFYNLFVWATPLIIVFTLPIKLTALKTEIQLASWKIPVMAATNVFGFFFNLKALTLQEASIIAPLISLESLLIVILGTIFLKETDHLRRKALAAPIAFLGALLLNL